MANARVKGCSGPLIVLSAISTLFASVGLTANDAPPDWLDPNSGSEPPSESNSDPGETVEVPVGTVVIDDTKREPILLAKTFNVRVLRRSTSNRVYMFEKTTGELPEPGRILLVREGEKPVMGFRVIRVYPETQTLAARKVKRYSDEVRSLRKRRLYTAIEKVADLILESEIDRLEKSKDDSDLNELELAAMGDSGRSGANGATATSGGLKPLPVVAEFDPELDAPVRGPFADAGDGAPQGDLSSGLDIAAADDELSFDEAGLVAREVNVYDMYANGFTASGAFHRNNGPEGEAIYLRGVGFKYSRTASRMVLLKRTQFQDSLSIEGGLSYYKVFVYAADNDAYGVVPFTLGTRYNIHFSPTLSLFFYAGVSKPFVIEGTQATPEAVAQLEAFLPAAGAGLILGVGPNWDLRADVGFDQIGAGLMLRF